MLNRFSLGTRGVSASNVLHVFECDHFVILKERDESFDVDALNELRAMDVQQIPVFVVHRPSRTRSPEGPRWVQANGLGRGMSHGLGGRATG